MTKAVSERELVLGILMEVLEEGQYSHIVLRGTLEKYQYMEKKERAFITRVTEGTLEHLIEIDYILDSFSKVKVKKMKPVIRNILRSAVYQLKYMDSVPDSAVCNEAVKLAVKKGFGSLRGFVNGVLRNTARNLSKVEYPKEGLPALSVKYSMPEWILKMWEKDYGMERTVKMAAAFQQEKAVTIRCNGAKATPEELKEALLREGVRVKPHPYLPCAFRIDGYDYLKSLETFRKGWFVVQDISSMLAVEAAGIRENDTVIDVCAAPGGKALYAAELLKGSGYVEARDLTEYKRALIEENIERTGFANIRAVCMDARILDSDCVEKADVVLADLPCSGLGVLGKKTDLKYRINENALQDLVQLQREILTTVQSYVKPGGTLLYSTCTVHGAENEGNVHWFLEEFPQFSLETVKDFVCEELKESVHEEGWLQMLPGIHDSDGFFIARLVRK